MNPTNSHRHEIPLTCPQCRTGFEIGSSSLTVPVSCIHCRTHTVCFSCVLFLDRHFPCPVCGNIGSIDQVSPDGFVCRALANVGTSKEVSNLWKVPPWHPILKRRARNRDSTKGILLPVRAHFSQRKQPKEIIGHIILIVQVKNHSLPRSVLASI